MVTPLVIIPLLLALLLAALLGAVATMPEPQRRFKRISRALFGRFVDDDEEQQQERKELLQAAYVAETYNAYAAKTYLYAVFIAVIGGIVGAYVIAGAILAIPLVGEAVSGLPNAMVAVLGRPSTWSVELSATAWAALLLITAVVSGVISGVASYSLRWQLLSGRAESRRRQINESLPRTVAFLYAQSRGGMPFQETMRTLAKNRSVYGETAAEITIASREMDLFGTDMISAIQGMANRTPSEDFKTFGENLSSVLQSGQSLADFLKEQYDRYQEDAEERQEEILELLATLAEGYVTVLVAGTLFFITILLVFGLTTSNTLGALQMIGYVVIPLLNLGFMVFLDSRLQLLGIGEDGDNSALEQMELLSEAGDSGITARATDGGQIAANDANFERLDLYDRFERIRSVFSRPLEIVFRKPDMLLYVTVPLALVVTAVRLPNALTGVGVNVRILDDILIQAVLFVTGTYAVARLVYKRRLRHIEEANPEFLERLASLNEAGMSIVESFDRVRESDLDALAEEVERIWIDIKLGSNVEDAIVRFGRRVRTTPVTRSVTLISNAMRASGNIGEVLRIAATQARADVRMKRQRRRQMLTYLVVIYISFAVFLVIIVAVQEVLVPSLPDNVPTPGSGGGSSGAVGGGGLSRLGNVNKAAYTLIFFHTALVQAVMSGLVGGQIGEGAVRDGVKHAFVLLGVAYVAFLALSNPVATLEFQDQFGGESMTVETATLSDGGYIVLHADNPNGTVIGRSEYLPPGTHKQVRIQVNQSVPDGGTVVAIPHRETNGNEQFDYDGGAVDPIYPPRLSAVKAEATIE